MRLLRTLLLSTCLAVSSYAGGYLSNPTSTNGLGGGGGGESLAATLTIGNNASSIGASNVGYVLLSPTNSYGLGPDDAFIGVASVDNQDTNTVSLSASSTLDQNRAPYISMFGSDAAAGGQVLIYAATGSAPEVSIKSGNSTNTFSVRDSGVYWNDNLVLTNIPGTTAGITNTWLPVTNWGTWIGNSAYTAIVDALRASYWGLTSTGNNNQIFLSNNLPTNVTASLFIQIHQPGSQGVSTVVFHNVYSPGGVRTNLIGSVTNGEDTFEFRWPGTWASNQAAGKWMFWGHQSSFQ